MKKALSILLSMLLAVNLAGCNSSSNQSSADQTSTDQASTGQADVSDEPAAALTGYADTLFDTSYVHEIHVEIAEEDWADLLENPTEKTKYSATVTIDGTTISEVSFATKGNTSLTQVANTDSDRYSFKLNFGKFVDGQTYNGLDKLNLNNAYGDATYIKDYLSYRIMAEAGADAPLASFVSLYINGEYYGLYTAIEEVGDSFLERNYGSDAGELYKPESEQLENMDAGGGMGGNPPGRGEMNMPEGGGEPAPEMPDTEDAGKFTPPENGDFTMPENSNFTAPDGDNVKGGFGSSPNGASLVYTDDEAGSYSDIFNNAETNADEEDYQRVIAALKQLSTGENLEVAVDVEAVLRYFVAHNFVINYDSYTGSMLHNYYLYEEDGILTMLPWDYNLAFGGFNGGSATESINWPIDSPLASNVSEDERPMWSMLAANETYLEMYHIFFDELVTNYFESGRFEDEIDAIYALIRPYVETDPTAFYTVEEFETAVQTIKRFCLLRAESIRGQLDGVIPSTAEGQQEDDSVLIDASGIDIQSMGSMGGAGGSNPNEWPGGGRQGKGQWPNDSRGEG